MPFTVRWTHYAPASRNKWRHGDVQSAPLSGAVPSESQDVLNRAAAHRRLAELSEPEAAALGVEYQLVTEYTSCVLVHEREASEKAEGQ
jgi:hypothetical protein